MKTMKDLPATEKKKKHYSIKYVTFYYECWKYLKYSLENPGKYALNFFKLTDVEEIFR